MEEHTDHFERHFTLDEAVGLLPFVRKSFEEAHQELRSLYDDIVLHKRIHMLKEEEQSDEHTNDAVEALNAKWQRFEETVEDWITVFSENGILVKDMRKGLIDFPYKAQDGHEYLLCWHLEEDGLFYFHDIHSGYSGRQPITLLPD